MPKKIICLVLGTALLAFSAYAVAQNTQPTQQPVQQQAGGGSMEGVNNARGVLDASAKMDNCEGGFKTDCTRAIESIMGVSTTGDRVGVTFGRCKHGENYSLSGGQQNIRKCAKGIQQQPGEPVTPEQIEAANGNTGQPKQ